MRANDATYQKYCQTNKVFGLSAMLIKLLLKNNPVKIDMDKAKNTPAQYLAQPISYICFTHSANLYFKIVKIR